MRTLGSHLLCSPTEVLKSTHARHIKEVMRSIPDLLPKRHPGHHCKSVDRHVPERGQTVLSLLYFHVVGGVAVVPSIELLCDMS